MQPPNEPKNPSQARPNIFNASPRGMNTKKKKTQPNPKAPPPKPKPKPIFCASIHPSIHPNPMSPSHFFPNNKFNPLSAQPISSGLRAGTATSSSPAPAPAPVADCRLRSRRSFSPGLFSRFSFSVAVAEVAATGLGTRSAERTGARVGEPAPAPPAAVVGDGVAGATLPVPPRPTWVAPWLSRRTTLWRREVSFVLFGGR